VQAAQAQQAASDAHNKEEAASFVKRIERQLLAS
jgi:hypothetical protein